jgi:hypothetical protein
MNMAVQELKKAMSDRQLREILLNREKYVRDTLSAINLYLFSVSQK